jgi:HlyD family secretion protein
MVQPGQTLAEIAPSTAPLILSAWLPNEKAGLVEVGMPANIKLEAFPYQDYGIVAGSVLAISPDSRPHEQMGQVYKVEVALDKTEMNHEGAVVPLRAGQTATAEIVVKRRRIMSLILDPIRKLQKDNLSI